MPSVRACGDLRDGRRPPGRDLHSSSRGHRGRDARAITDEYSRAWLLRQLAARLPEREREDVLSEALQAARASSYGRRAVIRAGSA